MISRTTRGFWDCFDVLPESVQLQADRAYELWSADPFHNSLHFKCIDKPEQVYSVRIGIHWRALSLRDGDVYTWFWIGSHADYDRLVG